MPSEDGKTKSKKLHGDRIVPFEFKVRGVPVRQVQLTGRPRGLREGNPLFELLQSKTDSRKTKLPYTSKIRCTSSIIKVFYTCLKSLGEFISYVSLDDVFYLDGLSN